MKMKGLLAFNLFALAVSLPSLDFPVTIEYGGLEPPSQQCLQVFQQAREQNLDNRCMPIDKIIPIVQEIKSDSADSSAKMNQIADIICQQAPACTPDFLNTLKESINTHCVGPDANNVMVTNAIKLINNYTPAREMGCLKDPSSGAYCSVEAVQWVLKDHLNINNLGGMQPFKELCTPCTKSWIEQYDKYVPQYPDLEQDPYLPKLKAICHFQQWFDPSL